MQTLCCCSPRSEAEQNIQISEPCNQTYHCPKEMMAFYHVPVDSCRFALLPQGIVIFGPKTNSRWMVTCAYCCAVCLLVEASGEGSCLG